MPVIMEQVLIALAVLLVAVLVGDAIARWPDLMR
jgi:hypothetical protein